MLATSLLWFTIALWVFRYLSNSQYIRDLLTLVVGYGMAINIVEVTWKGKLKAAFPDPNSYSVFMGNFSTLTGEKYFTCSLPNRLIPHCTIMT